MSRGFAVLVSMIVFMRSGMPAVLGVGPFWT
jgi:hypothetical protein